MLFTVCGGNSLDFMFIMLMIVSLFLDFLVDWSAVLLGVELELELELELAVAWFCSVVFAFGLFELSLS